MTAPRRDGGGTDFGAWLRENAELDSNTHCLNASDVDMIFHHYQTAVDGVGTRDVQLQVMVEIKSYNAMPAPNQIETLFDMHQLLSTSWKRKKFLSSWTGKKRSLRHFGVFVLSMAGATPLDGGLRWFRFDANGKLWETGIDIETLTGILKLEIDPEKLQPIDLRRHHKTSRILESYRTPLGFMDQRLVVHRS